ncbi:MAG: hypothetical protein ACO29O_02670, partial [Chitinophagaceae bacterium]
MRVLMTVWLMLMLLQSGLAQKFWDGGGRTDQWSDSANWFPDGIPISTDVVILNNQFIEGDYVVSLPIGSISTQILSLTLQPTRSQIMLILPSGNTASPGLQLNAIDTGLYIHEGSILKNSSGASTGNSIQLTGKMVIYNGGRYIHQTARSNASISDKLVFPPGTTKGIFEFDVPGTAGYTISITGKTFGNLYFKSQISGGNKSYSGSGSSNLTIKGDLWIDIGANVTSTMTADIMVSGNVIVDGKLSLNPSTAGTASRRILLDGVNTQFGGKGTFTMNSNFRNIEIARNGNITLNRTVQLTNASNMFINNGKLQLDSFYIAGPGRFIQMDSGYLSIGDCNGINLSNSSGNIRTDTKSFSKIAHYHFNGKYPQVTGDALPDTIKNLTIDNPLGIHLSKRTLITDSLYLSNGILFTTYQQNLIFKLNQLRSPINLWNKQNSGYEYSYINGPFTVIIPSSSTYGLPSGSESGYAPINISNLSDKPENYELLYTENISFSNQLTGGLLSLHPKGSWSINTTSTKYKIAIPISDLEINTTPPGTILSFAIFNESLQSWTSDSTGTAISNHEISLDQLLNGNQHFTLGYSNTELILPLEVQELQGRKYLDSIQLFWKVFSNGNRKTYTIQESPNGILFKDLGVITLPDHYPSEKRLKWQGKSTLHSAFGYFRIKYFNGKYEKFSEIIKFSLLEQVVQLYPNPASEFFF